MALSADQVVLVDTAARSLTSLESSSDPRQRSIGRRVRDLEAVLLKDCLHGEVIRKRQIPRALRDRYDLENLYCEDLPDYWRLLYTVVRGSSHRVVAVVAIVDHPSYSRWFPGRRT